ncbi:hypothetical protein CMI37_23200 [Candidatus Pacearchaeota archaeon]|nr:hypothetical protein [Candidatus Pacearchaeota archaeon]
MAATRKTAETLANIRYRVQRDTGDLDGERWSTENMDEAINNQLIEMGTELAINYPGDALLTEDLAYSTTTQPVDLPDVVGVEGIYRVDDISTSSAPFQLSYVSPLELDEFDTTTVLNDFTRHKYTLYGPSTDAQSPRIQLLPKPASATTLRIYYIATPYHMTAAGDTSPLSPRWVEVVSLGAALKLLRRDEEATSQQMMSYGRLWMQFQQFNRRQKGPRTIRRRRKGVS